LRQADAAASGGAETPGNPRLVRAEGNIDFR
jgi:hypothetical protein